MIYLWHRLGIIGSEKPACAYPIRLKIWVNARQGRDKALQQFLLAEVEVFVVGFQVIANVQKVITAEMLRWDKIGVFYHRQERESGCFRNVEPVISFT